jgi:putative transposase
MSARSTFYDVPAAHLDDAEIVGRMQTICDESEAYGYRRVGAIHTTTPRRRAS